MRSASYFLTLLIVLHISSCCPITLPKVKKSEKDVNGKKPFPKFYSLRLQKRGEVVEQKKAYKLDTIPHITTLGNPKKEVKPDEDGKLSHKGENADLMVQNPVSGGVVNHRGTAYRSHISTGKNQNLAERKHLNDRGITEARGVATVTLNQKYKEADLAFQIKRKLAKGKNPKKISPSIELPRFRTDPAHESNPNKYPEAQITLDSSFRRDNQAFIRQYNSHNSALLHPIKYVHKKFERKSSTFAKEAEKLAQALHHSVIAKGSETSNHSSRPSTSSSNVHSSSRENVFATDKREKKIVSGSIQGSQASSNSFQLRPLSRENPVRSSHHSRNRSFK